MTREEILIKAAGHLRETAEALRETHTLADGTWFLQDDADRKAKADHDEMHELAASLLAMARPA